MVPASLGGGWLEGLKARCTPRCTWSGIAWSGAARLYEFSEPSTKLPRTGREEERTEGAVSSNFLPFGLTDGAMVGLQSNVQKFASPSFDLQVDDSHVHEFVAAGSSSN